MLVWSSGLLLWNGVFRLDLCGTGRELSNLSRSFLAVGRVFRLHIPSNKLYFDEFSYVYKYFLLRIAEGRIPTVYTFFFVYCVSFEYTENPPLEFRTLSLSRLFLLFQISTQSASFWLVLLVPRAQSVTTLIVLIGSQFVCFIFYIIRSSTYLSNAF